MDKRLYKFSYWSSRDPKKQEDEEETRRIHHLRDGDAFSELADVFYSQGYKYGGLILNWPSKDSQPKEIDLQFLSSLTASDLIVLTTRPPLDDEHQEHGGIRPLKTSGTQLEKKIFMTLRQYFEFCSRKRVVLSAEIASKFKAKRHANKADITFFQHGDKAGFQILSERGSKKLQRVQDDCATAVYMLYTRTILGWEGASPSLLVCFGMGGTEGLIWAHLLRVREELRNLLLSPRFVMAEMIRGSIPPEPTTLAFADSREDWPIQILIDCPPI